MKHVGQVLALEFARNDAAPDLLVGAVDGQSVDATVRFTIANADLLKVVRRTLATGDVIECTSKDSPGGTPELVSFGRVEESKAKRGQARHLQVRQVIREKGKPQTEPRKPGEISESKSERIGDEGENVFSLTWEANYPGGNGVESILRWRATYYYAGDHGTFGPFSTLRDALQWSELNNVGSVTESITCSEMDSDALARLLTLRDGEKSGFRFEINGEQWAFDQNGNLNRAT